jgi:hypothetical protein
MLTLWSKVSLKIQLKGYVDYVLNAPNITSKKKFVTCYFLSKKKLCKLLIFIIFVY